MNAIEKIDKNFAAASPLPQDDLVFHNARKAPFSIHGLLYEPEDEPFRRIPQHIAESVNAGTLHLHTNTAGGRVRFCTDSARIAIRAVMPQKCLMPHMPFLGSSGFDLYEQTDAGYSYRGSFTPPVKRENEYESVITLGSAKLRALTIHFPLYDNVAQLYIGLDADAQLLACKGYTHDVPILFYGSSITQGGCASRPGNGYTNILSRNLDIDHRNLGFSGNSRGELAMADYIAQQPMSLFFYDYDHNAPDPAHLARTHEAFFLRIREKNPDLPIILASRTDTPKTAQIAQGTHLRKEIVIKTYTNAQKRGDKNVRFIDGSIVFEHAQRLGIAADSCTVDGVHPNDLGFACMAYVFEKEIRSCLHFAT